jgi:hypothetical protein
MALTNPISPPANGLELSQQEMASFASAAAGVADHLNYEGKLVLQHENGHNGMPLAQ